LEGSGRGLIEVLSPGFVWRDSGKPRNPSDRTSGSPDEIQADHFSNMNTEDLHYNSLLGSEISMFKSKSHCLEEYYLLGYNAV
jgi:hypothetical protein